jgi:uncharacterized protein (DUF952 family)
MAIVLFRELQPGDRIGIVETRNYCLNSEHCAIRSFRRTPTLNCIILPDTVGRGLPGHSRPRLGRCPRRFVWSLLASASNAMQTIDTKGVAAGVRTGFGVSNTQDRRPVRTIYKICDASAWREAERQGAFHGSPDDLRDGFIHFSTAAQVGGTLRKHFAGRSGLFLIAVDADALGEALRWEPSRDDELFPHLYGALDLGTVSAVFELQVRSDGSHDIPELEP